MSTAENLQTLEQYCETLFNPPDQTSRIQAEDLLNYHCPTFSGSSVEGGNGVASAHNPNIKTPIESALVCRNLLESARSPYALMFATSRLKTLVEDHFSTFTNAEQHGLRSFVLQYIYQNPDLPPFIHAAQAQLFAVITKLGWAENEEFRPLLDHVQVFFQHGIGHRILGLQILTSVITEMNIPGTKNFVKHRRSAVGFRDLQLLAVFQAGLAMLRTVLQNQLSNPETEKLKEAILLLLRSCLSYDFIGALQEESSEDMGSIQVPAAWKVVFEQPGYLDVLWESWKSFTSPASVLVMECLSQAVSIRRSIFSSDSSRNTYIYHIMRETLLTLKTTAGQNKLQDVGNFHEFCRMLSRFKNTFQLTEICNYSDSEQWLSAVGEFTVQGFHSWKWSPSSVPYLLTFWNKTISSLINVKQETEHLIEAMTVNLTREYLKSLLEGVRAVMDGEVDDPLESEEALLLSLEMFANIARTKYTESGNVMVHEFKELLTTYRELVQRASAFSGTTSPPVGATDVKESLLVIEAQLTWMVYIMAACIGARAMYQSKSEDDQMDGELTCEVFGFIHELQIWTARRPLYLASADGHLYVQSAIIYFYTQFKNSYISDNAPKVTKVYTQLATRWGLNTPDQVLDVMLNFSLNNLRSSGDASWRKQESQLVFRTLKLLASLASGYSSVKHIRKLDTTKALLKNHTSSDFRFLDRTWMTSDAGVSRSRVMYYTTLSRILFAEDQVDADFWRFVKPWETTLDQITRAFQGSNELSEEDIRLTLLGIFKDMRGFVVGISNRKQYNLFFEWFYPTYTPIVSRAIEVWHRDKLSIAILRFWHEFTTNKSSRITFDSSSPDGIMLFRETSNILYIYGQSLLNSTVSNGSTLWSAKYKGIMLYFEITSASLSGRYANFGVFKLYGDKALDRVLDIFFQLVLIVPVEDMVSFPKLARAFFGVIDVFASEHMTGLPMMPHAVLAYIFQALGEVIPLPSPDATCSSMACSATDKICTFVLNWLIKNKLRKDGDGDADEMIDTTVDHEELTSGPNQRAHRNSGDLNSGHRSQHQGTHWLVEYVLSNKRALSYLFMILFKAVAFENRSNHWSLSRPLLGLILLNREFYAEYVLRFVRAQLPDRQEQLQKAIDALMEDVENNLTTANRDRFTTNTTTFRRECSQWTLMPFNPEDTSSMF
ncbi:armadillo-type protein [Mortierella sp. GBAus27b]|nr:armadillo-type protein [Mortierella sp. GBAus27b]